MWPHSRSQIPVTSSTPHRSLESIRRRLHLCSRRSSSWQIPTGLRCRVWCVGKGESQFESCTTDLLHLLLMALVSTERQYVTDEKTWPHTSYHNTEHDTSGLDLLRVHVTMSPTRSAAASGCERRRAMAVDTSLTLK